MVVAIFASNSRLLRSTGDAIRAATSSDVRDAATEGELEDASVIVGAIDDGDHQGMDALARARAPVVLIGRMPDRWVPSCWFPRVPAPPVVASVLRQLAGEPEAAPRSGRRRSDLIIGESPQMRAVRDMLDRLAHSDASVLVTGESGTGKELVARALHFGGHRADGPWIAINCAAIPPPLVEAELFGHERGAFTDAGKARIGCFEAASGGTLFLDEIGELPLSLQPKLLRVLESREVVRLGGTTPRPCDVRVVSATNRRLEEDLRRGAFREDLYYRIRVFPLQLPPLRDRPEDVPLLVAHALVMLAGRERRSVPHVTPAALEQLLAHDWPGNVRELFNVLQRAMLVAGNEALTAEHLALGEAPLRAARYLRAKADFDARYYSELLRSAGGNVSLAARIAGRGRKEVYRVLRQLEIDADQFRGEEAPLRFASGRRHPVSGVRPAVRMEDGQTGSPTKGKGNVG